MRRSITKLLNAEANFRDSLRAQHSEYLVSLERSAKDIQQRLWADLEQSVSTMSG